MSQHIDDVLSVLTEMLNQRSGEHTVAQVRQLRIRAVQRVASKRGVGRPDIDDALRRRLNLKSVPEDFDPLVASWLAGYPEKLRATIYQVAQDDTDRHDIQEFFKLSTDMPEGSMHIPVGTNLPIRRLRIASQTDPATEDR